MTTPGDKAKARELGLFAEQMAAEYLLTHGYTVRERNWRPPHSKLEVDIIAQLDDTIVFVEVKARSEDGIDPADAVDSKKIRHLARAADIYLNGLSHTFFYRFDIITFSGSADSFELDHIADAFLPPLSAR